MSFSCLCIPRLVYLYLCLCSACLCYYTLTSPSFWPKKHSLLWQPTPSVLHICRHTHTHTQHTHMQTSIGVRVTGHSGWMDDHLLWPIESEVVWLSVWGGTSIEPSKVLHKPAADGIYRLHSAFCFLPFCLFLNMKYKCWTISRFKLHFPHVEKQWYSTKCKKKIESVWVCSTKKASWTIKVCHDGF